MFARVEAHFHLLGLHGPVQRYYPKPSKSVPFVHPKNSEAIKLLSLRHLLKVCMGARYLGGCIGDDKTKHD